MLEERCRAGGWSIRVEYIELMQRFYRTCSTRNTVWWKSLRYDVHRIYRMMEIVTCDIVLRCRRDRKRQSAIRPTPVVPLVLIGVVDRDRVCCVLMLLEERRIVVVNAAVAVPL